jgi:hypothetical protein
MWQGRPLARARHIGSMWSGPFLKVRTSSPRVRRLGDGLIHEGARLIGAGHHAKATAEADKFVNQYDAIAALERGPGRAYVDAERQGEAKCWRIRREKAATRRLAVLDQAGRGAFSPR